MDRKMLAIGILIGIAIVGCLAVVNGVEGTNGRYQFPPNWPVDTSSLLPILDTQTGTLNWHHYNQTAPTTIVYPFLTEPAQ